MITIKHREFANVVKTTAKMVLPLTSKKEKLQAKLLEVAQEIEKVNADIATYQDRVKALSGGLTTEQLVVRKKDAEGKYTSLFVANPEYVRFDEEKRVYVIIDREGVVDMAPDAPTTEEVTEVMAEAAEEAENNGFDPAMA